MFLFEELKKNSEIKGQSVNQFQQSANNAISMQQKILIDEETSLVMKNNKGLPEDPAFSTAG